MIASLKKLYALFSSKERLKLFLLLILMTLGALLEMIGVGSIPAFIFLVSSPEKFFDTFPFLSPVFEGVSKNNLLLYASLFLIIVFLLKNIFISFIHIYKTRLCFNHQVALGKKLFNSYSNAPWIFHLSRNSAELLRNVNNEIQVIINNVLIPILGILMDVLMVGLVFLLLLFIEPVISILIFITFGLSTFIFLYFSSKKLKEYGKDELVQRKKRNKIVMQVLGGLKELIIYQKLNFFSKRYHQSALKTARAQIYRSVTSFLPKPFLETVAMISVFLIALVFILQGRQWDTMLPIIALFGTAAAKILPVIKQILTQTTIIRFNHVAVNPVFDDICDIERMQNPQTEKQTEEIVFVKKIEAQNISFKYPGKNHNVIKEKSFEIEKGKFYRLKGKSGIGKTTVLEIISGILQPDSGKILVDGIDVFSNVTSWQKRISYVPQNIFFFDDTIQSNIAPGVFVKNIDVDLMMNSLKIAKLDDFINSLPDGLNTKIGERGLKISGGQRQRLGIARAMYHQPELLILDEGTSEVEEEIEVEIIEELSKIKGLTVVYVSHKSLDIQNSITIQI
jgi:ATP-binding cassette, subfamily B, bacterial PglK